MREYLKFSLSMDDGEASITPASEDWARELMEADPLLACDLLKDVMNIAENLYADALDAMASDWKAKRAARGLVE